MSRNYNLLENVLRLRFFKLIFRSLPEGRSAQYFTKAGRISDFGVCGLPHTPKIGFLQNICDLLIIAN
jgi:hypothetical protein